MKLNVKMALIAATLMAFTFSQDVQANQDPAVSGLVNQLEGVMEQMERDIPLEDQSEDQRVQMDILAGVISGLQSPPVVPSYEYYLAPQSRDLVREKRTWHLYALAAFAAGTHVAEPIRNWLQSRSG